MQIEIVGVYRNALILEPDNDFHTLAFCARREIQQRMFIEPKLRQHAIKADVRVLWHRRIVDHPAFAESANHKGHEVHEGLTRTFPFVNLSALRGCSFCLLANCAKVIYS